MASGRMRIAMGLTVVGAVLLITGLLMILVGEALRLKTGHGGSGTVRVGEVVAFLGLAIGVGLTVALTSGRSGRGRADRGPADRARSDRARADRAKADREGPGRGRGIRRGRAPGTRRDPAQEWLSPLRTPGAGFAPQRVVAPWHGPAEQDRPGSDDYSDDGWKLPLDDGWSPGPAYVWAPGEEDWDGQGEGDWDPDDGTDWAPGELPGPGAFGTDAAGPQHGHMTGPRGYPNGPAPGYLTGPQPFYAVGPEPEPLGGPAPAYLSDTDAAYVAPADASYLTEGPDAGPARGPGSAYGPDAGPVPGPGSAHGPEAAYPEAPAAGVADPGTTQRDDDTSPIPVIRDQGQPAPQPLAREPEPAPKPFSVWEPAPKPFSVWEPAPKPGRGRDHDPRSDEAYRPAHAEPPSPDTQEKIDQIKDLYLTAEAIGDDALGKHFDELHQRQRSLIREFFEKAGLGSNNTPSVLGDDSAQDGAPLPG
jgi:hypothetical protein